MYDDIDLYIDGTWRPASDGRRIDVMNPATGLRLAGVAHAGRADLDEALETAERGFRHWRDVPALTRSGIMRGAASLLRERCESVARLMTQEQGKPLAESRIEVNSAADTLDWFAEEGRRAYGRLIPPRVAGVRQIVTKEPVGPVAAFTPWNFPINQAIRKVAAALAAGCSVILKAPEETPASPAAMVRCLADAGLPKGVLNLVYGDPAEISGYLIPHPVIRKISFTGSTAIGKHLAAMAGSHMKRATMELGGHAPAVVCADADLDRAASLLAAAKFRNAGQVCIAPTRFLVQDSVHDAFVDRLVAASEAIVVGDGLDASTTMGPLANGRRLDAMEALVGDAVERGATLRSGGRRIGNAGHFFAPTVLTGVPLDARAMNEEPFGPVALVTRFGTLDEAIAEANRLPYGLAAYAHARSSAAIDRLSNGIEAGMVSINHNGLGLAETPFGGVQDSGYGSEGGPEALEAYLVTKFTSVLPL